MKKEENKNKIINIWIIGIITIIFYFSLILLTEFTLGECTLSNIIIIVSTILLIIFAAFILKMEIEVGYYVCKKCNHKYTPTYKEALFAMHTFTRRYLKCPKCNKKTWAKKVINK